MSVLGDATPSQRLFLRKESRLDMQKQQHLSTSEAKSTKHHQVVLDTGETFFFVDIYIHFFLDQRLTEAIFVAFCHDVKKVSWVVLSIGYTCE